MPSLSNWKMPTGAFSASEISRNSLAASACWLCVSQADVGDDAAKAFRVSIALAQQPATRARRWIGGWAATLAWNSKWTSSTSPASSDDKALSRAVRRARRYNCERAMGERRRLVSLEDLGPVPAQIGPAPIEIGREGISSIVSTSMFARSRKAAIRSCASATRRVEGEGGEDEDLEHGGSRMAHRRTRD